MTLMRTRACILDTDPFPIGHRLEMSISLQILQRLEGFGEKEKRELGRLKKQLQCHRDCPLIVEDCQFMFLVV